MGLVSFIALPLFQPEVLGKIGSIIGIPILVDEITTTNERLDYAHICVEINPLSSMPTTIFFENEDGEDEVILIEYE